MLHLAPTPVRPAYLRSASSGYSAQRPLLTVTRGPSWFERPGSPRPPSVELVPGDILRRLTPVPRPEPSELPYLAPPPASLMPLEVIEEVYPRPRRAASVLLRAFATFFALTVPAGFIYLVVGGLKKKG